MLAFVLALLFDDAPTHAPKVWTSRAAFHQAIKQVKDDWTRDQVFKVLGRPDDVWPRNDSSRYVMYGDEAWCYGTNGHHTMPTLGYVVFREGKVLSVVGGWGDPPPVSIISEAALVATMRFMYRKPSDRWNEGDPLRLVQVANALIPFGKEKALAVMREYSRLDHNPDDWLFWLVRVMFDPIDSSAAFRVPRIGAVIPSPPQDLRQWPTYPLIQIDDIPISLYKGASLAGFPEPFEWYVKEESKNWRIKTKKLTPPNDPFPVFLKVLQSPQWPFKDSNIDSASTLLASHDDAAIPLKEILRLVRTAYRPIVSVEGYDPYPNGLNYGHLHTEFLFTGVRWDEKRQMYVRLDGSFMSDKDYEYTQCSHVFNGVPGLELDLIYERQDPYSMDYTVYVKETGREKVANAVIVAVEADTGKELHWMVLNQNYDAGWTNDRTVFLDAAPHSPFLREGQVCSSGFRLAAGKKLKFVVLQASNEYASPTFTP